MATKSKSSLRDRLAKKREELNSKGPGKFITCKEGITRVRILSPGAEQEWAMEVVYFYTGLKGNMYVISPATFGEKCALMEAYNEMANSKNAQDREFANAHKPGKRYMAAVVKYVDDAGKEVDKSIGVKLIMLTAGMYQDAIDLWMDDDNGDFTDPINGYDLKIKRTGKGKQDTEYTILTGKVSKLDKAYRAEVNLEEMVRKITPSYKETKKLLDEWLNLPPEEDAKKDGAPKKKKKKSKDL